MARLMRRQTSKWAAGMQPRNGSSREAQGVTNPAENKRLQMGRDILKKATAFFAKEAL